MAGSNLLALAVDTGGSVRKEIKSGIRPFNLSPLGILRCTYVAAVDDPKSSHDRSKNPKLNALFMVTMSLFMDLIAVVFPLAKGHPSATWLSHLPKEAVLAIAAGLFALTYLYFETGTRHDVLVKAYRAAAPQARRRIKIVAICYVVGSLVILPAIPVLLVWLHR